MRIRLGLSAAFVSSLLLQGGTIQAQSTQPVQTTDDGAARQVLKPAPAAAPSAAPQSEGPQSNGDTAMPESVSRVRIVRLSQVHGNVQLDRNIGRGYESAFANIPITQGSKLRTGEGAAEVEFEDNSSLRITPHTDVTFKELGRSAAGGTLTAVEIGEGMAYLSVKKSKTNFFTVGDGQATILMAPGTHARLLTSSAHAELAVFEGQAKVAVAADPTVVVDRSRTFKFDPSNPSVASVDKKTEPMPYDQWDKSQKEYHDTAASFAGMNGSMGMYGANDLNYYGSFADAGCGSMWRPYFASAGWSPYSNGAWAYYPGAGYSWVSPYPWGWLPFHSGQWTQCGSSGWGWQPGNQWYGLNNSVLTQKTLNGGPAMPMPGRPAPGRPTAVAASIVPVNTRPLTISGPDSKQSTFVFRKDSAGLGVPRAVFGQLQESSVAVQHNQELRTQMIIGAPGAGAGRPGTPGGAGQVFAARPVQAGPTQGGTAQGGLPGVMTTGGYMGHPVANSSAALGLPTARGGTMSTSSAPAPTAAPAGGSHK